MKISKSPKSEKNYKVIRESTRLDVSCGRFDTTAHKTMVGKFETKEQAEFFIMTDSMKQEDYWVNAKNHYGSSMPMGLAVLPVYEIWLNLKVVDRFIGNEKKGL